MERKNTILLTVIAVATLLVAVVGATFAYFTATTNVEGNNKRGTDVTTAKVGGVTLNLNDTDKASYLLYPGGYAYVGLSSEATKNDETDTNTYRVSYKLNLEFKNETKTPITWTLYESNTALTATKTCTPNSVVSGVETQYSYTCTGDENNYGTAVAGATGTIAADTTTAETKTISLTTETGAAKKYYYLVIDYPNSGNQDADQGKLISASITGASEISSTLK